MQEQCRCAFLDLIVQVTRIRLPMVARSFLGFMVYG